MNDQQLNERITRSLQQDCETLPAHLRSRLNRSRQQALDAAFKPHPARWLPAGLASALALVLVVWMANQSETTTGPVGGAASAPLAAEDLQLLAEPTDLELIEDLEFYAWLEETDDGNS